MMLVTLVQCELEEVVEVVEIMGDEEDIIILASSSYMNVANINTKARGLGIVKLLIVVNYIEVAEGDSSLLVAKFICYGPKNFPISLHCRLSTF